MNPTTPQYDLATQIVSGEEFLEHSTLVLEETDSNCRSHNEMMTWHSRLRTPRKPSTGSSIEQRCQRDSIRIAENMRRRCKS